jgi:hypothetical protein
MDLVETGWGGVDSIGSGYGPVAGCCEGGDNLRILVLLSYLVDTF